MDGSVFKRCGCPTRLDARGRKLTCAKQHGSWYYKLRVDAPAGRRQVVKGGFPTKAQAEQALAELRVGRPGHTQPGRATSVSVREYLEQWLVTVRPTLEAAAWANYSTCLRRYVLPHLGSLTLTSVTGARLSEFYALLVDRGGKDGRPLSHTTVRTAHRLLHKCFGDAVREDLLAVNPADRATPPKRRRYEPVVWDATQAAAFLRHARGDRLFAAWLVALT